MYIDSAKTKINGKIYERHLLRVSFREGGKVKHRTIANISKCSREEIEAIRLALRHKSKLTELIESRKSLSTRQGLSIGAVWTLFDIARRLGIDKALGPSRDGRLALWQVIARVIDQGSRLSAVRLAGSHAACDILGLEAFSEDDLYSNLDWLSEKQAVIEDRLFRKLNSERKTNFFLYDVTSSYFEGAKNELAAWGYNRDGKRGKKQIVIGLLCDGDGEPVSVEVFRGNTQDPKTFASQIGKVANRFGSKSVTFVGDRGMIKSRQIEELNRFNENDFHYITAITKPQIEALLKQKTIQLDMFDEDLAEVLTDDGVRYILRRNPARAMEISASRKDKLARLKKEVEKRNAYLKAHPRAKIEVAKRDVLELAERLVISDWALISSDDANRRILLKLDESALAEKSKLDGCYVLKTDLNPDLADKNIVHARYKDLSLVETAFRTLKTAELEVRPIHVRLASRTRGHVFVATLAYRIVRELSRRWRDLDTTVQEGIDDLSQLCVTEILDKGRAQCCTIPEPRPSLKRLLDAAKVQLPEALPCKGINVTTKRKLPKRRRKD